MKFLPFTLSIFIFGIYSTNIYSDVLYLKNKNSIQGIITGSDENHIFIYNYEKYIKVPVSSIESAELGYSAIVVCMEWEGKVDCNAKLHSLQDKRALLLKDNSGLELIEIPTQKITKISWKKKLPHENPFLIFPNGHQFLIETENSRFLGILKDSDPDKNLVRFQNLETREIQEWKTSSILQVEWDPTRQDSSQGLVWNPFYLLPGYPQLLRGEETKAILVFTGSLLPTIFSYSLYQSAKSNASAEVILFSFQNQLYYYQKPKSKVYQIQITQSRVLGWVAIGVFLYHLWDGGLPIWDGSSAQIPNPFLLDQGFSFSFPEEMFFSFPLVHQQF